VVPASFHDFFTASATVAGALIGLLFVAVSVSPEKLTGGGANAIHQARAAAAFSALVNTLVIALVALLPGTSLGDIGLAMAVAGIATTGGLGALLYGARRHQLRRHDVSMLVILLALYAFQLNNAVGMGSGLHQTGRVSVQGLISIGFFLFGIARAWQIAGARNLGLLSTVATVIQRQTADDTSQAEAGRGPAEGRS
jgi:hypothetical protein